MAEFILSAFADEGGKSIDTTMGFTPLEGLTMGTRSGSLDPALIPFLMKKTGKTADDVGTTVGRGDCGGEAGRDYLRGIERDGGNLILGKKASGCPYG